MSNRSMCDLTFFDIFPKSFGHQLNIDISAIVCNQMIWKEFLKSLRFKSHHNLKKLSFGREEGGRDKLETYKDIT